MNEAMLSARRRRETIKIQVGRERFAWLVALALAFGCRARAVESAEAPKAAYDPEEATLFNDFFRPELFGLEAAETAPESDRLLYDRVARADVVVAARIVTVTREADDREPSYSIVLQPTASPLVGRPNDVPPVLKVRARSAAYAWIDANRDACVGIRALIFARNYEDGLHFHGSIDNPAVRDAVIRARIEPSRPR